MKGELYFLLLEKVDTQKGNGKNRKKMALSKEQNSLPNGDHFDSYFCDDLHSSQSHPITRYWQQKSTITFSPKDFVLPIFLMMDESANESIENFPNIKRMGSKTLIDFLSPLISEFSLQSILLFPCLKNTSVKKIDDAFDVEQNPLIKGIDLIKKKFPQLLIIVDVCLCTFTEHGLFFLNRIELISNLKV